MTFFRCLGGVFPNRQLLVAVTERTIARVAAKRGFFLEMRVPSPSAGAPAVACGDAVRAMSYR